MNLLVLGIEFFKLLHESWVCISKLFIPFFFSKLRVLSVSILPHTNCELKVTIKFINWYCSCLLRNLAVLLCYLFYSPRLDRWPYLILGYLVLTAFVYFWHV